MRAIGEVVVVNSFKFICINVALTVTILSKGCFQWNAACWSLLLQAASSKWHWYYARETYHFELRLDRDRGWRVDNVYTLITNGKILTSLHTICFFFSWNHVTMPPQQKTIAIIKCCKVLKQFTLLPTKLQCIETLYSPFYKVTNSLVREANIVAVRYCATIHHGRTSNDHGIHWLRLGLALPLVPRTGRPFSPSFTYLAFIKIWPAISQFDSKNHYFKGNFHKQSHNTRKKEKNLRFSERSNLGHLMWCHEWRPLKYTIMVQKKPPGEVK